MKHAVFFAAVAVWAAFLIADVGDIGEHLRIPLTKIAKVLGHV